MAFTTATVARIEQGNKQFQGIFTDMWALTLTVDPASIGAGSEDTGTFTIPGVAVGDMVFCAPGVNPTIDGDIYAFVSAANTLTIRISNLNSGAALDLATATWKVLVGRPSW